MVCCFYPLIHRKLLQNKYIRNAKIPRVFDVLSFKVPPVVTVGLMEFRTSTESCFVHFETPGPPKVLGVH